MGLVTRVVTGMENPWYGYYYMKLLELENGLVELVVDKDVYEMLIGLWLHYCCDLKPDSSSGNERSEVDVSEDGVVLREKVKGTRRMVQNLIEDVDVDMAEFKRHVDPGVEWLGCKENVLEENEVFELEEVDHEEFDSRSDSDEGVRRKALRKVARMNRQYGYPCHSRELSKMQNIDGVNDKITILLEAYEWFEDDPTTNTGLLGRATKKQYSFRINLCEVLNSSSRWNGQAGVTSHGDAAHGSQQAGVAGHGDVAHGSQQAGVHGSQTTEYPTTSCPISLSGQLLTVSTGSQY
ncbi:hypothetical protein Tco_0897061 [Tanacetum coccineum]